MNSPELTIPEPIDVSSPDPLDITPSGPIKKKRSPGRRYLRFFSLAKGEEFSLNKLPYVKTGFWTYSPIAEPFLETLPEVRTISPLEWVRSTRPVKGAPIPLALSAIIP